MAQTRRLFRPSLAHCLALAYNNQQVRSDAQKLKSEHRQTFDELDEGATRLHSAYRAIFDPAEAWLAKHYESGPAMHHDGKQSDKLKLTKCIDFYNSPALHKAAEEYARIRYWNAQEAGQAQHQ